MRNTLLALLLLVLVACGAAPTTSGNTTGASPSETTPVTTTATPSPASAGDMPQPGTVEALVAQQIGTQLQLKADQLRLVSKAEKDWPDGSLGCRKMGVMYIQMVIPGLLLHYTDGTKQYEVHTDKNGSRVVVCQDGHPLTTN
ncbi:MAG: hypothetical protein H0X37_16375 [Herpetosiphonaceae bacterium]|nr:hypothetical protein [Herpetosiphonaceae bacterium]